MGRREQMVRIVGAVLAMGVTLLTSLPLQAQTVLFGPTQYTRTAGPPNQFTATFALPAGAMPPYTLHIVNGHANGTNRISSARVTLNGTEIAGPNDFGQNVAVIDRTVSLQAGNTLQIRLTSAPGSFITISVLDTGAGAQPTALTPSPLHLAAGATGTLTAILSPAPPAAGTLTVTSANAAVVTAPASVSFAAGQTSVPIPVTAVGSGSTTVTVSLNGGTAASQVDVALPLPTIAGFTPTSGQPGTSVTVTGTNFVNVQTVAFNGVMATFTATDATTVVAVVPPGATTGPLAVQTLAGTATSATNFTVIPAPTLASLQPATLTIVQGETGTLTVTLHAVQSTETAVTLSTTNSAVATVPATAIVSDTQLSTSITVTAVAPGQADITASLNGTSASSTVTVVHPVPSLTTVSPTSLPSGSPDSTLTLTGQQFVAGATVQFGSTTLATTFVTATQLSAVIPAAALTSPGTVPVTVTNPALGGGLSNSLPLTIVNGPPPLNPIGNQTVPLGSTLSFTVTATDPDGDPVTFAVTPLPLPPHMTFNSQTGLFSFTPDATQVGTLPLTFLASDGVTSSSESISLTVAGVTPGAPTSLSGRVDDSSGNPVAGVPVLLKDSTTPATTSASGQFTLAFPDHPAGRRLLVVAGVPQGYANLVAPVDLIAHTANVLPNPITTPPLDLATAVTVNPVATTTLTSATARVTVLIPPGRAKNADGTAFTGELTISPVPEYGRPESRPVELRPGLSVTIQPAGIVLDPPVPITFPNNDHLAPGNELDLWSLSPDTGTFFQVGTMRVSADGQRLETVSGGVRKTAWHFALAPNPQPNSNTNQQAGPCTQCAFASQGDLTEGALTENITIPGIRSLGVSRDLTLRYTSTTADVQPILPINAFLSVRAAVPPTFSARLSVGGVQQGQEVYWDSHALPENGDSTSRLGLPFDASALATGHYPYELTLFSNYPQSSIGGVGTSRVLVRNERQNSLGAGWTLSGLDRLYPQSDTGSVVVLAEGQGSTKRFAPVNLLSWWSGDGTANDTMGGNNGTLQNGTTFAVGKVGQAFSFDGVDDFVSIGTRPDLQTAGAHSVTAWARVMTLTTSRAVVTKYRDDTGEDGWSLTVRSDGRVEAIVKSAGPGATVVSPQTVSDGQFHHLAMTWQTAGGTLKLYIDGVLVGESAPLAGIYQGNPRSVFIGRRTSANDALQSPFSGQLDEVSFYSDVLTAPDIQKVFAAENAGRSKPLQGPPGEFSTIVKNADSTYTRTMKDGSTQQFTAQGLQTSVSDRNGNQTTYGYDRSGNLLTLTDPAGQVTTFAYSGSRLATLTDPQGRVTQFTHDGGGNLTGVMYADTSTTTCAYDPQHRLIKKTDAQNQVTQYDYDYAGRLSQAILPGGDRRVLTSGQRTAVPNLAAGQGTLATPAALSTSTINQATFTDAKNQTTRFETDVLGRVIKQIDALNRVTTITRDARGNPTQIVRPNGAVTTMTYDAKGNLLTSTEQAIAATTTLTYEPTFNQVTSIRDPKGTLTQIAYDAKGNPLSITDALNQVTTFTYNPQGLLLTTQDALNQTTTFTYDPLGRLLTTTDPLTRTTTLTYDAAGNVATSTDALNRVTTFQYDPKNRLREVRDTNDGRTSYSYDGNGNLLTVTDAKNQVTTFAYDGRNRLLSTTDPLGKIERYTYDGNDNLLTRITPNNETISFAYDAVNQLLSKTLPGSQVTSYLYDLAGNVTTVTDPDSVLAMTYDLANRLSSVKTDGSPNQPAVTLNYAYDPNGNRTSVLDPVAYTQSGYDGLNRLTTLTGPFSVNGLQSTASLVSTWLAEGTAQDALGGQHGVLQGGTTFGSGELGQAFQLDGLDDYVNVPNAPLLASLTSALTVEAWINPEVTGVYSQAVFARRAPFVSEGFMVEVTLDGRIQVSVRTTTSPSNVGSAFRSDPGFVTYGQWNHVAVAVQPASGLLKVFVNGHDVPLTAFFGPATLSGALYTQVNQLFIGRRQDTASSEGINGSRYFKGRIDELRVYSRALTPGEVQANATASAARYAYDALSRRTNVTLPNGIQTTYSYDAVSQLSAVSHQLTALNQQINKAEYGYNAVGNRTSLTDRRGPQTFGYDQLDRLTSASHPLLLDPQAFAYDAVGNRTTGGSVVNAGNQLTADVTHSYQYDDNGNLTRKTLLATGNYSQYTYDAENRLTKVEDFVAGNPTAAFTATYRYDGLGRRIEKVANGQTKRYIYDGEDILLEYDGSNVLQARYTHGPGIDEPLSRTPMVPGLGSGHTAVLASTPDGLRGPVVDDGISVNGQVSVGFTLSSGVPTPAVGQPIDSTGSHQPIAPIDVTAATNSGTLTVNLIDTGGIGGNAPLYLVTRDQTTGQAIESRLLFPARATFASTTPLGTPLVVASATVPTTTPVANGTLYYHQDGIGTVTELTDVNGAVAKAYAYDAYGSILESPGTVEQPYTYTAREFDSETGLYYYRARYYDATTGRFLQNDPIGLRGGLNVYRYVDNNPSNWTDATGLTKKDKTYGLPSDFWKWYHRQQKRPGDPDLNQDAARDLYEEWKRQGRPDPEGHKTEPDRNSENEPFGYCPLNDPVPPVVVVPAPDDQLPDNVFGIDPRNPRIPRIPGRLIIPAPRFIIP